MVITKVIVLVKTANRIGVHGRVVVCNKSENTKYLGTGNLLMLVWQRATTVKIHHFFLRENAYAVCSAELASLSMNGSSEVRDAVESIMVAWIA